MASNKKTARREAHDPEAVAWGSKEGKQVQVVGPRSSVGTLLKEMGVSQQGFSVIWRDVQRARRELGLSQ